MAVSVERNKTGSRHSRSLRFPTPEAGNAAREAPASRCAGPTRTRSGADFQECELGPDDCVLAVSAELANLRATCCLGFLHVCGGQEAGIRRKWLGSGSSRLVVLWTLVRFVRFLKYRHVGRC